MTLPWKAACGSSRSKRVLLPAAYHLHADFPQTLVVAIKSSKALMRSTARFRSTCMPTRAYSLLPVASTAINASLARKSASQASESAVKAAVTGVSAAPGRGLSGTLFLPLGQRQPVSEPLEGFDFGCQLKHDGRLGIQLLGVGSQIERQAAEGERE